MSNDTFCPSVRVRRPAASTAVAWTNTSLPPPSGAMKPKPLLVLKNLTVPMVIFFLWIIESSAPATTAAHGRGKREHQFSEEFRLVRLAAKRVGSTEKRFV